MTINLGSFPRMLQPGLKTIWGNNYKEHKTYISEIFEKRKSDKNSETSAQVTGFGYARVKNSGGEISMDYSKQGYSNTVAHVTYGLGYRITEEQIQDNLYKDVINKLTPQLARSLRTTKEVVGHSLLNNAVNTAYTYGDGKPLLATDHPTQSGNQSNKLAVAADLSPTSLKEILYQIKRAKDDRGLPIDLQMKNLIVPTELEFTAKEIMKSVKIVDSNWNNINLWNSEKYIKGLVVSPYLVDTDAWFVSTDAPDGLIYYERMPVKIRTNNDFNTIDTLVTAHERYSFTCNDWRSIYGSEGAD